MPKLILGRLDDETDNYATSFFSKYRGRCSLKLSFQRHYYKKTTHRRQVLPGPHQF